jgi:hypothetical protein
MSAIPIQDWIRKDIRGVVVKGILLRRYEFPEDASLLDQDLLEVQLPNGIKIDVGWFPENDPGGKFIIRTYRKSRRELLRFPTEATDPFDVARTIVNLIEVYASSLPSHTIPVSSSGSASIQFNSSSLRWPVAFA